MTQLLLALYNLVQFFAEALRNQAQRKISSLDTRRTHAREAHIRNCQQADDNFNTSVQYARDIKSSTKANSLKQQHSTIAKVDTKQRKQVDKIQSLNAIK